VRQVQEWLCLQGINVTVDSGFGPATEAAVKGFQTRRGLGATGIVNQKTWDALVEPMTNAMTNIPPGNRSLGGVVVAYAEQHLAEHPREVGGQNMGPWVRLYTGGKEGSEWAWCAGFACFVLRQAAKALSVAMPLPYTLSCDSLAASAKERGLFVSGKPQPPSGLIPPGSLLLSRRTALDWVHTGIILASAAATFDTIEGNTNDAGDREGYEVCRRIRGYGAKDFVVIA